MDIDSQTVEENRRKIENEIYHIEFPKTDVDDEHRKMVETRTADELLELWAETVGRWLLSRSDIVSKYDKEDGSYIIEQELKKSIDSDKESNYGF